MRDKKGNPYRDKDRDSNQNVTKLEQQVDHMNIGYIYNKKWSVRKSREEMCSVTVENFVSL